MQGLAIEVLEKVELSSDYHVPQNGVAVLVESRNRFSFSTGYNH